MTSFGSPEEEGEGCDGGWVYNFWDASRPEIRLKLIPFFEQWSRETIKFCVRSPVMSRGGFTAATARRTW